jgi:hypothetical protein
VAKKMDSKWGEGTGGPVQVTSDPNNPTYDTAMAEDKTDQKIRSLCEPAIYDLLSSWEKNFLTECYGSRPLRKAQHVTVWKLYKRYIEKS